MPLTARVIIWLARKFGLHSLQKKYEEYYDRKQN